VRSALLLSWIADARKLVNAGVLPPRPL